MKKAISKLNKKWHLAHRMPENAAIEERIVWHLGHSKKCGCRPIPDQLKAEIKKRNIH